MRVLILLISLLQASLVNAEDRLVVLDVGEGQAVLLKHETRGILIDTGHAGMATKVLQRLQQHRIDKLEYIILTHLHPDHASGYFRLKEAFPYATIFYNRQPLPKTISPDMVRWINDALQKDQQSQVFIAGDRFTWHGFQISCLWPEKFVNHNLNLHSLVLLIEHNNNKILLMGDTGKVVERQLLQQQSVPDIEVLIAGHHGAADTGEVTFIKQASPDYSVISVNQNNIRGYPDKKTLQNLQAHSKTVLRTDNDGEICFRLVSEIIHVADCAAAKLDKTNPK